MKSLVIGAGQIGKALQAIFLNAHVCAIRDVEPFSINGIEVLHIAYPYTDSFVLDTRTYMALYRPKLTIIHSTVAVGTTDQLGDHVVHSPERGRYPHLADQMRVFPKFIGGGSTEDRELARHYFDQVDWTSILIEKARWTELVKVLSNVHLGLEIAWRQEVDRIARSLVGEPAGQVYADWEGSYNEGYKDLGHQQLIRPIVRPAPIGGHCILPCTDILQAQFESRLFQFIKDSNAQRQAEEIVSATSADGHR